MASNSAAAAGAAAAHGADPFHVDAAHAHNTTSHKLFDLQKPQQQPQNVTATAAYMTQSPPRDRVVLTSQHGESLTSESEYV